MKILHIAHIGTIVEGIGTTLNSIVNLQIALGCHVKVISFYKNKIYENLSVITMNKTSQISQYIIDWKPDIVIFHGVYFYSYAVCAKKLKKIGIPYVVQLHGALSQYNMQKNRIKKSLAIFLFIKEFLKNAVSIIYLSKDEYLRSIVPNINKSFRIIPNGCLASNVSFYKKEVSVVEIVFIGRIDYIGKGLDLLLESLYQIRDPIIPFHVSLYGTGTSSDVKKLCAALEKLSYWVSYMGEIYGNDKVEVLKRSDIFILTSRSEGMPMGILEALSYGLPCIVSPETNMANLIIDHEAGWRTELNSRDIVNTINIALREYSNNSIKYRMNAFSLAKEFSWSNAANKSVQVLRELSSSV